MRKMKGITLIALVVTIVAILIIAGVSISVLAGENGIINRGIIAKKQAIISNEKEILHLSTTSALSKNKNLKIEQENLEYALNYNIVDKDKSFEIIKYDNDVNIRFFVVKFLDSKNVYLVEDRKEAEWIGNLKETEDVVVPRNLMYGLDEIEQGSIIQSYFMHYSYQEDAINVTADRNDGWGMTDIRCYLEKGNRYCFECTIDGIWRVSTNDDTVEAYLSLDKKLTSGYYVLIRNNVDYRFSLATIDNGLYYLRLDVNQEGKTHTFSNISVKLIIN